MFVNAVSIYLCLKKKKTICKNILRENFCTDGTGSRELPFILWPQPFQIGIKKRDPP